MRIVLVGAGEVGYSVAKNLSEDGHNIVVIEENEERANRVDNDLDVIVVRGNGARPSVLASETIARRMPWLRGRWWIAVTSERSTFSSSAVMSARIDRQE